MIMSERDSSFLCPLFAPDGLLLNLQVHGNLSNLMQNKTYNPNDQHHFSLSIFLFSGHDVPTSIGAYWRCMTHFKSNPPRVASTLDIRQKCTLFSTRGNWNFKGCLGDFVWKNRMMSLCKSCSLLRLPQDGSIFLFLCLLLQEFNLRCSDKNITHTATHLLKWPWMLFVFQFRHFFIHQTECEICKSNMHG